MPVIAVHELRSATELAPAFAIRRRVFVEEQAVSEALEFDGRDDGARHLLALVDGEPAGTLRIRLLEGGRVAKIERVAVLAARRRHRVGRALLEAALQLLRAQDVREVKLHAQTAVQAFYAGLGFVARGNVFEEDGILHVEMRLPLAAGGPAATGLR
ncbi:MAG TPA: GNAT family N-acetyltransferase [Geminicoccaceae bacterium]|nr:GNAT family N-acetyltransferase [Geminicoccaceae bacterium]